MGALRDLPSNRRSFYRRKSSADALQSYSIYLKPTYYKACSELLEVFINAFIYFLDELPYEEKKMHRLLQKFSFSSAFERVFVSLSLFFGASLILNSAVISCSKRRSRMLSSTLLPLS